MIKKSNRTFVLNLIYFLGTRGLLVKIVPEYVHHACNGYGSVNRKTRFIRKCHKPSGMSTYVTPKKDKQSSDMGFIKQEWKTTSLRVKVYRGATSFVLSDLPIDRNESLDRAIYRACAHTIRGYVNKWELTPKDLNRMMYPLDVFRCMNYVNHSEGSARFRKRWKAYDAWIRSSNPQLPGWVD